MKELKQQQIVGQYSVWEWCKKKNWIIKAHYFSAPVIVVLLASQQTKKLSWYVAKASQQQQRLYDSQNWDTRDILPQFLESWEWLTVNGSEVWKRYHKTYSQWWIIEWNAGRFLQIAWLFLIQSKCMLLVSIFHEREDEVHSHAILF